MFIGVIILLILKHDISACKLWSIGRYWSGHTGFFVAESIGYMLLKQHNIKKGYQIRPGSRKA